MKKTCFFNDCDKKVNARGKFCEEHDKLETEASERMAAIFANLDNKNGGEKNAD